ncbi:uncharacterized protein N7500_010387 [Penicillium coprophilum]|uniref:uncharacterized protein n=1 Tax=Penicillium coprophilum TaxID=36646 RepID=UPI002398FD21|nr:uncharacterized protein N7500_010387 [Penicillium coprophilum]KAJ5154948.1 hypothetical protein N7500_010387 [Penicillium coprophilum]
MSLVSQSPTLTPRLNVHYLAPGFSVIPPKAIDGLCQNQRSLLFCHGVTIVKISPEVVVKMGAHINFLEVKNMIYIVEKTRIPLFAYYTYGPIDRDPDDYGGLYVAYIFMDFIDGDTLHTAWDTSDVATKTRIST